MAQARLSDDNLREAEALSQEWKDAGLGTLTRDDVFARGLTVSWSMLEKTKKAGIAVPASTERPNR
jgi:hypothetical protein